MSNNGKTIEETLQNKAGTHPQLNIPNVNLDINRTFTTSRIKLNEQAIIELYANFSDYISSVIRELEDTNPQKVLPLIPKDKPTELTYADIFSLGAYPKILDEIAHSIFRSLENERSTPKLLRKFIKTFNLNIPTNLQGDALAYLEVRHLIIHANNKADAKFHSINNQGLVKVRASNQKIIVNYQMTSAAILKVSELCKRIDDELSVKGLI